MGPAGIDIYRIAQFGEVVQQLGLNCEGRTYNIPIGLWGGRVGAMLQQDLLAIYDSLVPRYHKVLKLSPVSTDAIRNRMIQEWAEQRTAFSMFVVFGQK